MSQMQVPYVLILQTEFKNIMYCNNTRWLDQAFPMKRSITFFNTDYSMKSRLGSSENGVMRCVVSSTTTGCWIRPPRFSRSHLLIWNNGELWLHQEKRLRPGCVVDVAPRPTLNDQIVHVQASHNELAKTILLSFVKMYHHKVYLVWSKQNLMIALRLNK